MTRMLVSLVLAAGLSAATDPFVGTWKLDPAKSKFTGEQMKIEDLGQNRYKLTGGMDSDTLIADGTDQPVHYGRTESITRHGANSWTVVTKKDGKVLSTATWTLSPDGKSMTVNGTTNKPNNTTGDFNLATKRVGAGSGFAGTWESTQVKISSPDEFVIAAWQGDGLSFTAPAYQDVINMKFDGREYPETGPNVAPGSTTSGKRVNANTLELTDKIKDKVADTATYQVSADGKTLTMTIKETGQPNPVIAVYEKK